MSDDFYWRTWAQLQAWLGKTVWISVHAQARPVRLGLPVVTEGRVALLRPRPRHHVLRLDLRPAHPLRGLRRDRA